MEIEQNRITIWDSMKGIAIIGIFLVHNYVLGNLNFNSNYVDVLLQAGRYGVEITFIVNAYFYALNYEKRVRNSEISSQKYVMRMIIKTIPVYYLALFTMVVFDLCKNGKLTESFANLFFHIAGIHALNSHYFNTILPGGGYIGVLYVCWIVYALYCKFVDAEEKSIVGLVVTYLLGYIFMGVCVKCGASSECITMIQYYVRAAYSFAAGNFIYHCLQNKKVFIDKKYSNYISIIIIVLLLVFIETDYIRSEQFVLLISVLIVANIKYASGLIDNSVFSLIGRYCFEIYLVHVVLFGILPSIMQAGKKQFLVMVVLTVLLSYIIHKYITLKLVPKCIEFFEKRIHILFGGWCILVLIAIMIHTFENYEVFVVYNDCKDNNSCLSDTIEEVDKNKHSIIVLLPGVYEDNILLDDLDVTIIGLNKQKTVIINESGRYDNAPIVAYGKFGLYNMTVKMTLDKANGWEPTYQNWPEDFSGYALHIEGDNGNTSVLAKAIIKNCIFYSEANTAIGAGLHNNQWVTFEDCDFIRNCKVNSFKWDNCKGAFVAHCSNEAGDINQKLILYNNYFYSNYGYAGNIMGSLPGGEGMSILAIGNNFYSEEMDEECFFYDKGDTELLPESKNNNVNCLNAK